MKDKKAYLIIITDMRDRNRGWGKNKMKELNQTNTYYKY